jgi:hypothetical protein
MSNFTMAPRPIVIWFGTNIVGLSWTVASTIDGHDASVTTGTGASGIEASGVVVVPPPPQPIATRSTARRIAGEHISRGD